MADKISQIQLPNGVIYDIDTQVQQTASTIETSLPILLGYKAAPDATGVAYYSSGISVIPGLNQISTSGTIYANVFNGELYGKATSAESADSAIKATQDASGNVITSTYETKADASAKLTEAKLYADSAASTAAITIKNDLLNGAGEAYDTLKELGDLIDTNVDAIEALEIVATGKADKEHTHVVADITDMPEIAQADWNENNTESPAYIVNRPFYEAVTEDEAIIEVEGALADAQQFSGDFVNPSGDVYRVHCSSSTFGDIYVDTVCAQNGFRVVDESHNVNLLISTVFPGMWDISYEAGTAQIDQGLKVCKLSKSVVTLDEKYIPDSMKTQADWSEEEETSAAYILNKPFGEEKSILWQGDWATMQNLEMRTINRHKCVKVLDYVMLEDWLDNHYYVMYENGWRGTPNEIDEVFFVYGNNYTELAYGIYAVHQSYEENGEIVSEGLWVKADEYYFVGEIYSASFKTLDPKYLPDTVAMKTDIPEQVQADWNENDTESPAYIINRPFYTGNPVETILLDNHTGTYAYDSDAGMAFLSENIVSTFGQFVIGETYNVVLDGTSYNDLIAFDDGGVSAIGSTYGNLTNDLPFAIATMTDGDEIVMAVAVLSEAASHTLSISQTSIEIRKLEMKYLPDGYPYDYVGDLVIYNGTPWVDYDSETGTRYTTIYLSQSINLYEHSSLLCEVDGYTYTISPTEDNMDIWGNAYLVDKTLTETEEPPIALDISGCESGTVIFYSPFTDEHELKITLEGEFEQSKLIDERFLPKLIGAAGTGVGAEVFNSYDEGDDISTFVIPPSYFQAFNVATGDYSHAEGRKTKANGNYSHAEGYGTISNGSYSHAEGCGAEANGYESHAEGYNTVSNGSSSHAEGYYSDANGDYSHAEGYYTIAASDYQHVQGKRNIEDAENKYAHIVGNGTSSSARSNAHTLDWDGNAWYQGTIKVGGTSYADADEVLSGTVAIANGGTGYTTIKDTAYTTARYRASSLHSSETTPSTNGVICWTYE